MWWLLSSAWSSWFTGTKQGTLILFFWVAKPLYELVFDWNYCRGIGSEGKIWKSVQNSFFTKKMKVNQLGMWNIPFSWQTDSIFRPFSNPWGKCFDSKHKCIHVLLKKIKKNCYIFGKHSRNKCFRNKYQQFSAYFGQIFAFPTPRLQLFISFKFGNGSQISDNKLVILEFKYLQNKKW